MKEKILIFLMALILVLPLVLADEKIELFQKEISVGGLETFKDLNGNQRQVRVISADESYDYCNIELGDTSREIERSEEIEVEGLLVKVEEIEDGRCVLRVRIKEIEDEDELPLPNYGDVIQAFPVGNHVMGDENAPITIIEYADFEDPFGYQFYKNTLPQIKEDYIRTGKVKLIFMQFPLSFYPHSFEAAEASECAAHQDKFWEYHDVLFENQDALTTNDLIQYAEDVDLNVKAFKDCLVLSVNEYDTAAVKRHINSGEEKGVQGTPTFFINEKMIVGAQPYSTFKKAIDGLLNDGGKFYRIVYENEDRVEFKPVIENEEKGPSCSDGCIVADDKKLCVPFGTRVSINDVAQYCSTESVLRVQKEDGEQAENNYECRSNSARYGVCENVAEQIGILTKIFGWLSRIFN